MDFGLTWEQVLTVAGNGALTVAVFEGVKRFFALTEAAVDRFGPALASAIAIALAIIAALLTASDLAQAVLTGLVSGLTSVGIYKAVQRVVP